jgi:cell fate regulator YaaT (PSP1 superfamily)
MGCGNCAKGADGKPSGCKSNGGCSTGGCNRLNVYDWLSGLPLHDGAKPYPVMEVSFNKGSRKEFYRNNTHIIPEKGQWIAVEGVGGIDIGQVNLTGELVKLQMKKYGIKEKDVTKRIHRIATDEDLEMFRVNKEKEQELLVRSRAIARSLNLEMKLAEVELQADGKKATFFYTADQRVDFRELIKMYANDFRVKVEMKQIGARQESGKVGGIGSCGRELCCSTWLTDFKSVNTTAARYQNLSINQTKLSGQCGRLKCCLNYELDTYIDALSVFPEQADVIETASGKAFLQKRDIFKNLMWYSYRESNKQYPLSIERVKEILELNGKGIKPDELQPVELEATGSKTAIKVDAGFVNDVGQVSLRSLEKGSRKKSSKSRNKGRGGQGDNRGQQPQQKQARDNQPRQEGGRRPDGNKGGGNRPQRPPQGDRPQQPKQAQGNRPEQKGGGEPRNPQQGNRQGGNRNRGKGGGGNRPQRPPQGDRPQQG